MDKSHARGPPDTKLVSHVYDDFPTHWQTAHDQPAVSLMSHVCDKFSSLPRRKPNPWYPVLHWTR